MFEIDIPKFLSQQLISEMWLLKIHNREKLNSEQSQNDMREWNETMNVNMYEEERKEITKIHI